MSKDKESICVTVRVRPLSNKELEEDTRVCLKVDEFANMISMNGPNSEREAKDFYFDSVCDAISQNEMFEKVGKRSTIFCMEGYNCTIFAYGQTGAGKTYTMMGANPEDRDFFEQRGLVPRTLEHLFDCIEKEINEERVDYIIKCSFVEIYNEQIIDLLGTGSASLNIREDLKKGVYIEGVCEEIISQSEEAMEILRKGSKGRHVGSTFYNETSSRSHSVFTMQIESQQVSNGIKSTKNRHFHFIDLAGSERTKKSMGDRLKEGCSINKSLHVLSTVISSLAEVSEGKTRHVNYRDSKLTFLLKDSLGGNSKTHLIANISPSYISALETKSTLMFARKVKLIKVNKVSINEDASGNLESLKAEIRRLRSENLQLLNGGVTLPMTVSNVTANNAGNTKMVAVLQQYVDEELEKQTQLQLQITKLTNKNNNLQKGIQHFCENEKQLRMVISIYEDKIKKLKQAEETLIQQVGKLSEEEKIQEIKVYFQQEREAFLSEIDKYKKLSSSSSLVKNLLKELKMVKEGSENESEEQSLITVLVRNNEFLESIKTSIAELEPEIQEGKASKVILKENEELKIKNEEMSLEIEKYNLELTEAKDKMDESEALLSEAICLQMNLEKKLEYEQIKASNEYAEFKNAIETKDLEICHLHKMNDQMALEVSEEKLKHSEMDIKVSQLLVQISENKSELVTIKENKENEIMELNNKMSALIDENEKIEESVQSKIEEIKNLKDEVITIKSEWSKDKEEMKSILQDSENRIAELLAVSERLENDKKEINCELRNIQEEMQSKIDGYEKEKEEIMKKVTNGEKEQQSLKQELSKQKQENYELQQKYEQILSTHAKEQEKWEENNNELLKVINDKKTNDTETQAKLTESQLENIEINEKYLELSIQLKRLTEESQSFERTSKAKLNDFEEQNYQLSQLVDLRDTEIAESKKRMQILVESEQSLKRHNKNLEEQIVFGENSKEKAAEEMEKMKSKEKESRIELNELKNEIYALQKNFEVEVECLEQQLQEKEHRIECLSRECCQLKESHNKSVKDLQNKMENEYEILKENEGSIKKAMETHLLNKEKKLNELKDSNESYEQKLQQKVQEQLTLSSQIEELTRELSEEREERGRIEKELNEEKERMVKAEMNLNEIEYEHLKAIEEMENNLNEQIDNKNAEIEKLRRATEEQSKSLNYFKELNEANNKMSHELKLAEECLETTAKDREGLLNELNLIKVSGEEKEKRLVNLEIQLNTKQTEIEEIKEEQKGLEQKWMEQNENKQETIEQLNRIIEANKIEIQTVKDKLEELLELKQISEEQLQTHKNEEKRFIQSLENKNHQLITTNEELTNKIHVIETSYYNVTHQHREAELKCKSLENDVEVEQEKCLYLSSSMDKMRNENIDIGDKLKMEIFKNEQMESEIKCMGEEKLKLGNKINELFILNDTKDKQIINLNINLKSLEERLLKEEHQINENSNRLNEQNAEQINKLNELYEESKQKLNEKIKIIEEYESSQTVMRDEYEMKMNQVENQLKYKNEELISMESSLRIEKSKNEESIQLVNQLKYEISSLTEQQNSLGQQYNELKKDSDKKLKESDKKLQLGISQMNNLKEEIKLIEEEASIWKQRMESLENEIKYSNEKADKFKMECIKEKESNKEFKMLLDNAHCQIDSFKSEVLDKDKLYHQLLEKVSKNDTERKGMINQDKKFSDLLEKSRIEVSELRKKYDDQLKINSILKQEMEKKDVDCAVVKERSEEYCRKQQQFMESIKTDYTKIENELKNTKQSLEEKTKCLKKVTLKNEELEERIQNLNKECLDAQINNEELKKESLRMGIDERQTNYVNRLKEENTQLKRELEKTCEEVISMNQEKLRYKSEMRIGKESDLSSLELSKKISEVKYLQKIIDESINVLGIKDYKKSVGESLKLGILDLQRELSRSKSQIEQLNDEVNFKNQRLQILEGPKSKILGRDDDSTLLRMRNKIEKTSSNFETIRQSKEEDKLILQMKDPNKANIWGMRP